MTWTAGDAIVIIISLAIASLIGGWLQRWAARQDGQVDDGTDDHA